LFYNNSFFFFTQTKKNIFFYSFISLIIAFVPRPSH